MIAAHCDRNIDRIFESVREYLITFRDLWAAHERENHMTKQIRLLPFDYEKYKAGAKAVFRKWDAEVVAVYPYSCSEYPLMYVYKQDGFYESESITQDGRVSRFEECNQDILLTEELEEKTLYLNIYPYDDPVAHTRLWNTLEKCLEKKSSGCIGTLKVTYTEKDLIK